jgi:hypothetical protein
MELHHIPTQEVTPRIVKVILERLLNARNSVPFREDYYCILRQPDVSEGGFFPTFCSPHIGVGFAPAEGITRISGITCGQGH